MRIFATDDFSVFIEDNLLTNKDICQSAREIIGGLVDANLGGNLFKKRIAKDLLNISDKNIEDSLLYGLLIEVICDE
ncbi:type II toxin-antitoxin system RelE/ParE family toxin [Photorhabdus sp. RM323S]|uniref:type II toxin-antitoxin system RelE/ParE family toxin n=1 Tax=Photorhabdus sp. RM323S TaxID=3342828 RepID=UPI0036D9C195